LSGPGAGAIHLHPRDADGSGADVLEVSAGLAAGEATQVAVPGVPVGVTAGLWAAGGSSYRRLELVSAWSGPSKPGFASVNVSEPTAAELAALLGVGVGVEAGVWTVADPTVLTETGLGLTGTGLGLTATGLGLTGTGLVRMLVGPQDTSTDGAVGVAAAIEDALGGHGFAASRPHDGCGLAA
jgi:hypothetical protein